MRGPWPALAALGFYGTARTVAPEPKLRPNTWRCLMFRGMQLRHRSPRAAAPARTRVPEWPWLWPGHIYAAGISDLGY